MEKTKEKTMQLPDEITKVTNTNPRDLVIIGQPKIGKGTILGDFTTKNNALILDLENGGYEFIAARKISTYTDHSNTRYDSFQNYIKYRNLLLESKGKYEYLLIDGLSDLDDLSEIGGTKAYMNSIQGKKFNRDLNGMALKEDHIDYKSVLTLGDGAGYKWTRDWFIQQIDFFRQISPYRIYAAHVADKYVRDGGKEEVIGAEIALTGKLKTIFASKVTALAKLVADGDERYLNFEVLNDSIIAGSRVPRLEGKVLLSKKQKDGTIETYWENIYNKN